MKPFDYTQIKDYKLYDVGVSISYWLRHIMYSPMRIYGQENIPADGGKLVIAANHTNETDPGVISILAGRKHKIHFMGKQELFDIPVVSYLMTHFNGFPIRRGKRDETALNYAMDIVRSGRPLGMFIEGTRSRDGGLGEPKPGVALIARETGADILPVSIYSEHRGKFFHPVTVRYGKVIPHAALDFDGSGTREEAERVAQQIMGVVRAQWELGF